MKKKFFASVSVALVLLISCMVFFTGCKTKTPEDNTPKDYVIQYTDDTGSHKITVTDGMPFSLSTLPSKQGYEFTGLFDAEEGGTQYVNSRGSSLAPFTDKKNMVLFPQFKAKEYTIVLDYQGAAVTGNRQYTVTYGASLPELPKDLIVEHKEFAGWYTQANCGGKQIADKYGLIPLVSILNEKNFNLSDAITLYAGFATEMHTITFNFYEGMDPEEVQVPFNTHISQILPQKRVNGKAVLTWSKSRGGEVFDGRVRDDLILYAVEYAPVIDFNTNGGNEVKPIVARAGSTIALPTPLKDLAKFSHWEDMRGNKYEETTMPETSIILKAVWQGKLVFNENGGTDVNDISEIAGTNITLPTPEKDGFIFAGWYTSIKEQYTSTKMPAIGIALKAGWYKEKTKKIVLLKDGTSNSVYDNTPNIYHQISLNEEISEVDWSVPLNIHLQCFVNIKHYADRYDYIYATKEHFYFYSSSQVSDAYLMGKKTLDHGKGKIVESYTEQSFDINLRTTSGVLVIACASDKYGHSANGFGFTWYYGWQYQNFWMNVIYPDTTNLNL